jgi:hypothetical protein
MGSQRSHAPQTRSGPAARRRAPTPWAGPTLRQFVTRIEHAFGEPGTSALHLASTLTGLGANDHPSPVVLRRLCSEWGLPPEDFELEAD